MRRGRFTARPKEQYQLYGETYASANTIGNWFNFGGNQENNQNVANGLQRISQPAIQSPPDSGPIIEEVNSDEEIDLVEKLSSTMNDTTLEDSQLEPLKGITYNSFNFNMGPRCSTVQRGRGGEKFDSAFLNGDPDLSVIARENSVLSQLSTDGNRGVLHFDEVQSSSNGRGSKRSSQSSKGVLFVTPVNTSKRRYTPPIENRNQTPILSRENRSNSVGDISSVRKKSQKKTNSYSEDTSPEPENPEYFSDEEDGYSEAEDVEVIYSESDLSDIEDSELESVRENVRNYNKHVIAKNIKYVDKRQKEKNLQGTDRFSSSTAFQIPRAPFNRLVKEVYQEITGNDCRLGKEALEILQTVSEQYIVECFKMAHVVTRARDKATLYPRDIRAARRIMSRGEL